MTKMLANRLKLVLNYIILDLQSAFIPGRLIPNNVMIAFETGHYIRRNTKGKEGVVSLKMDMSKAYDIVEWGFLKSMIAKLGFCDKWINLIMLFVSSVRYMVRQEGNEIGPIIPLRGLQQGDSILPYLFLIYAEGLTSILNDKVHNIWMSCC